MYEEVPLPAFMSGKYYPTTEYAAQVDSMIAQSIKDEGVASGCKYKGDSIHEGYSSWFIPSLKIVSRIHKLTNLPANWNAFQFLLCLKLRVYCRNCANEAVRISL